jgi:hypothetical protein
LVAVEGKDRKIENREFKIIIGFTIASEKEKERKNFQDTSANGIRNYFIMEWSE